VTSALNDSGATPASAVQHKVVALGGGHGLAVSLRALRRLTSELTAVVTVADDGGSSGRLRRELGVLPPGDLRMALTALCDEQDWGSTWARVVQHRFGGDGALSGHAVGNLLITALWEETGDIVSGLDWLGNLLGIHGRVLPCSTVPLDVIADVQMPNGAVECIRGQVAVATTTGRVLRMALDPADPPACPQAIDAIAQADVVVIGPGSWFTSVLTHLAIPDLRASLVSCAASRIVVLNREAQVGETHGFRPETHLEVLRAAAPDLRVDTVVADVSDVSDAATLRAAAAAIGAELCLADIAGGTGVHDPLLLANALAERFPR
jgi:uncharacterized cofD-like protein